jgi:hypothetical protein
MNIRAAQRIKNGRCAWDAVVPALLVFCSILVYLMVNCGIKRLYYLSVSYILLKAMVLHIWGRGMMMMMIIIRQARTRIQKLWWASLHNTVKNANGKSMHETHIFADFSATKLATLSTPTCLNYQQTIIEQKLTLVLMLQRAISPYLVLYTVSFQV